MKIGFIGAGRVGTTIGLYLHNKNISILGYYSKSFSSAQKAAKMTNSSTFSNIDELVNNAEIIAITTPDDEISTIVKQIENCKLNLSNKVIFHMSGVHSANIFAPIKNSSLTALSIHPMLAISNPINAVNEIEKTVFSIEGEGKKANDAKLFIESLGIETVLLKTEDKIIYHAACCVISNYLVTLINTGKQMLKTTGLSDELANIAIKPLITKTINNILDEGSENALTGPISRGDIGTIQKHLSVLENQNNWYELYKILALNTVELAENSNYVDQAKATEMKEVLISNDQKNNYCNISKKETE